jgi:hypothetical protein
MPPPFADLFPPELTAIRAAGLVLAVGIGAFAIWRRHQLRNADTLILLLVALGLAIVAGTEIPDAILSAFSFKRENGTRIVGVAIFAILILFLLVLRALSQGSRITSELSAVLEGLAWEQFRVAGYPDRFRDRIAVLVPAYNEANNVGRVLDRIPDQVCGAETAVLVVDDGSRDGTDEVAAAHGAVVARHVINRGGGAALRTGYRLLADSGAAIVVTLDADGQHLPEEIERLVKPVLEGDVAVAHGSRVLGEADRNHPAREAGIVFFNKVADHPHPRHRLLERLPRGSRRRPAPAGPAPGAVPHLGIPDRGDQAGDSGEGGAGDRCRPALGPFEEAGGRPLRDGVRKRDRPDLAALAVPRVSPWSGTVVGLTVRRPG